MDLDYRREGGLDIVRRAIDALLPGVSLIDIDRERRELIFDGPDGAIPYRLLSEGSQNVAAWTGDLLYHITNTFEDSRSLHRSRHVARRRDRPSPAPDLARKLIDFVRERFPNLQVVATTHSPLTAH